MHGLEVQVDGETWEFRFLDGCSKLTERDRVDLIKTAIKIDRSGRTTGRRNIKQL